jgi:hypothetical protein
MSSNSMLAISVMCVAISNLISIADVRLLKSEVKSLQEKVVAIEKNSVVVEIKK